MKRHEMTLAEIKTAKDAARINSWSCFCGTVLVATHATEPVLAAHLLMHSRQIEMLHIPNDDMVSAWRDDGVSERRWLALVRIYNTLPWEEAE